METIRNTPSVKHKNVIQRVQETIKEETQSLELHSSNFFKPVCKSPSESPSLETPPATPSPSSNQPNLL